MTLMAMLRGASVLLVIVGVIDPSFGATERVPAAVELRIVSSIGEGTTAAAESVRRTLAAELEGAVAFDSDAEPVARVLVGDAVRPGSIAHETLPTSTVGLGDSSAPNVRAILAKSPAPVPVGWTATLSATLEARGMTGTVSQIVLEHQGVELARQEHKWSRDPERFDVSLPYAPPIEGVSRVTLRVLPNGGEADTTDNAVDLRLLARGRPLRLLVHEPRPSWGVTFVRRALERMATFDVATLVNLSKGLSVKAGGPPAALTADSLAPFDAVLVGAPEELGAAEVGALSLFARRRGGAIVFLPDRRPAGRYLDLMQGVSPDDIFDEVLVDRPLDLLAAPERPKDAQAGQAPATVALRASELALPRGDLFDADVLAFTTQQKTSRAAVLSWRLGAGRVIFSGALDAWRFRGAGDGEFDRFWEATIAEAALAAPPRLNLTVMPPFAAPGEEVTIRARLRRTELDESPQGTHAGPIAARIIDGGGEARDVRLWPTAEVGTFEGRVRAPHAGRYDVHVASGDLGADEQLTVAEDVRRPVPADEVAAAGSRLLSSATGGVSVRDDDLAPLVQHLRGLARQERAERVHPARSAAFVLIVGTLLCVEWTLRRRRGLA